MSVGFSGGELAYQSSFFLSLIQDKGIISLPILLPDVSGKCLRFARLSIFGLAGCRFP